MSIKDLLGNISSKQYKTAQTDFNNIFSEKLNDALEAKRIEVGKNIFSEDVELTNEEIDEICEQEGVQSLDELSGATLGSYMVKARKNQRSSEWARDAEINKDNFDKNKVKKLTNDYRKRDRGLKSANDKLNGSFFTKVHAT